MKNIEPVHLNSAWQNPRVVTPIHHPQHSFSMCHLTALGLHLDSAGGGWEGKAVLANSRCWSVLQGAGSRLSTDVWQREGVWQSGVQCWSVWIGRQSDRVGYRQKCHFFICFVARSMSLLILWSLRMIGLLVVLVFGALCWFNWFLYFPHVSIQYIC